MPEHRKRWLSLILAWVGMSVSILVYVWTLETNFRESIASRDVFVSARSVLIDILDIETGIRGYLITGKREYLEPYHQGTGKLRDDMAGLRSQVDPDTRNKVRFDRIEVLVSRMLGEFGQQIEMVEQSGINAGRTQFIDYPTKPTIDQLRVQISMIYAEEDRIAVGDADRTIRKISTIWFLGLLNVLITVLLALLVLVGLIPPPGDDPCPAM